MSDNAEVHKKGTVSLIKLLENVRSKPNLHKAGAVAIFVGVVRGENREDEKVQKLSLEADEEEANKVLAEICGELRKREGVVDVQIHPLLGEFNVGEDLVYILVTGSHREDVFPALEEAVEQYNSKVPILKKEYKVSEH